MATIDLTKDNIDQIIASHDLVLINFTAEWCGPCKSFAPIYEQVSAEYPEAIFGVIHTEVETELAQDFQVRSVPMLIILRQNIAIFSQAGTLPISALKDLIEQALGLDMDQVRQQLQQDDE